VKDHPAVDKFTPVAETLETEVVDEEVAVDRPGEANEGRHHLLVGANGIDEVAVLVPLDIRGKTSSRTNFTAGSGECGLMSVQKTDTPLSWSMRATEVFLPTPISAALP